jgi:hypothetical protein
MVPYEPAALSVCRRLVDGLISQLPRPKSIEEITLTFIDSLDTFVDRQNERQLMTDITRAFGEHLPSSTMLAMVAINFAVMDINGQARYDQYVGYTCA